ncbi:hypothetical protein [Mesorhizobium sp. M0185]|uniref:hypothetical protein n=1 Tax=Mesorhizobium sp. M0185 TaxID=2956907 RepID=UPI0033350F4C
MMIQINHRESHDVDIFLDDPQLLGFIDPSKSQLSFSTGPAVYDGDGTRFQKFAFEGLGEIDFIVAGARRPPGISGSCRSNKGAACRAESGVRQTDDRTAHDHARLRGDGC